MSLLTVWDKQWKSPREVRREIRLSRGAQPRGKVGLPEGPTVGNFPDNSYGFSTVSQTLGFKNRRKCVLQELSEHIPGFPQGSLTVLNPDFGFEARILVNVQHTITTNISLLFMGFGLAGTGG